MNLPPVFVLILLVKYNNCQNAIVRIEDGLVLGRTVETIDHHRTYYSFEGIPFARPPVGRLRFEPPQPPEPWQGIVNATAYRGNCVQWSTDLVTGHEDCLQLNVYTPDIGHGRRAVGVFIHGGWFLYGTSSPVEYGPDYFIDEDLVIVTMNYRLGVLGFLSTGDLVVPGNNGLRDQNLALKWVKRNIARFGGDPNRVTLMGQSAGAASVSYQMLSPQSAGLFNAAIMESASALCPWALFDHPREAAVRLAEQFHIDTSSSTSIVNGLRNIDCNSLVLFAEYVENQLSRKYENDVGMTFVPVMEVPHPGAFFSARAHQSLVEGKFQRVPTLLGFNTLEYLTFPTMIDPHNRLVTNLNDSPEQQKAVHYIVEEHFFGNNTSHNHDYQEFRLYSEYYFQVPVAETVRQLSKYVPTYFYVFSFNIDPHLPGTGHNQELYFLWQMFNIQVPPEQRRLVVGLWSDFIKTHNPTPRRQGITWEPVGETLNALDIGPNLRMQSFPKGYNLEFWQEIYETFGHPPFSTY